MIIDSHCHAGKGDGLTGPWDTDASLGKYMRRAGQAGITHTVLFAAFHSDYSVANRAVAQIVARHPNRLYEEFGFVGIKVHRHDGRITREICVAAAAYDLPVLYDVMGEVSIVTLLAQEYPHVVFIIPHLGSFGDDWAAQAAFIDQLARFPNIYTDTSGVRRFDLLEEAVQRAGASKILFGSDGPWLHPGVELAKVRLLGLSAAEEALILAGNFLRVVAGVRAQPAWTTHAMQLPRRPPPSLLASRRALDPWLAGEPTVE